jgi:hypothetical protein
MKLMKPDRLSILFGALVALFSLMPQLQAAAVKGTAGQVPNAAKLGAKWCYNWGSGKPSNLPAGVEFFPMWWSYYGATAAQDLAAMQNLRSQGFNVLLTYNEPDRPDQSNLTVAYALQGYRGASAAAKSTGMLLISPACADANSTWMQQFMAAVQAENLACHAVSVHNYNANANSFLSYVDGVRNRYGKNIYVTEFAPTDWKSPTAITVANCKTYMATAVPGLKSRGFVLRYSWYCGTLPGPNVLGTAALVNSNGTLTELGNQYKTY